MRVLWFVFWQVPGLWLPTRVDVRRILCKNVPLPNFDELIPKIIWKEMLYAIPFLVIYSWNFGGVPALWFPGEMANVYRIKLFLKNIAASFWLPWDPGVTLRLKKSESAMLWNSVSNASKSLRGLETREGEVYFATGMCAAIMSCSAHMFFWVELILLQKGHPCFYEKASQLSNSFRGMTTKNLRKLRRFLPVSTFFFSALRPSPERDERKTKVQKGGQIHGQRNVLGKWKAHIWVGQKIFWSEDEIYIYMTCIFFWEREREIMG